MMHFQIVAAQLSQLQNTEFLFWARKKDGSRELCHKGFEGEIIASDIADKALARAKEKASVLGYTNIKYKVADLNHDSFEGPFDFIFAEGVLHHIENIEMCLTMLNRVLAPNGKIFVQEFVGPVRFQLPEAQVRWINSALNILPKALRPFKGDPDGHLPASVSDNSRVHYVAPTEQSIIEMDPSEALSGPRIKALFPQVFEVVEEVGLGGTLLSYMTGHFDFARANTDPNAEEWLKVLVSIENALINTGILEDEFVFYLLGKRTS